MNSSEYTIEMLESGPLRVAGTLDTYVAAELHGVLVRALRERPEVAVDLSGVQSCDFTTIQLLCSAHCSAVQAGKPFTVTVLSEAITRTCATLGLSPEAFSTAKER